MARKKKQVVLEKLLVEDYAAEGKSLGRVDGKVIFIEQVVPGDVVDVRLGKNKKDWAEGRPIHFHSYSPDRVTPFCSHFGVCGGCQWQMLPYERQLQYKERQVKDNLQRIGKLQLPAIEPILGATETQYYRNKMEYTFGNRRFLTTEELGNPDITPDSQVAGFHARGMFDKLVDIDKCYLQAEPTNAIRKAIKNFGLQHGYSFYDIREHHGFLRTMQVRLCRSGELMVNVVVGEPDKKKIMPLMDHLLNQFP
ncbi:class I SAM-dependent RNA methyltransferase, partial [Nostoc ellipsosporum NOK]|nr:class I SAM-dependent RNA methyltransferase [Nostoc ellipsosporum NOK]